ncbi:hypothetical protein HMPREF1624_07696 [Sporothrix schenckii ATCC 58251]|uniref:glucan 1,3-beta-glucosidase n=1 Tax=Sporothrix schenckii (strain ATCC 58251 / de Perez 2211183) TaxID=1391915 RepID=U7PNT6_SPOS1|nr:hypothetical protein HMPREF1624_07696 [Sporothrix schenckii ATCC 58251]
MNSYSMHEGLRPSEFGSTDQLSTPYGGSTDKLHSVLHGSASGAVLSEKVPRKSRKPMWLLIGGLAATLAIGGIVVGVLVAKNIIHTSNHNKATVNDTPAAASASASSSSVAAGVDPTHTATSATAKATSKPTSTKTSTKATASPTAGACSTKKDIPASVQGTYNDPTTWLDMTDFNCTYTSETIGNLSIVGLNSTWDDSKQANPNVPALNKPWGSYSVNPIRAVNLGGWFSLEPFITPSLFNYPASAGVSDEYTLCAHLGPEQAAATLEKHYATFITEQDFADIASAGLSHVRIPYSYWAVTTYPGDPYVLGISWRYLLRAIEWARKHGLRVNLDLHAVPGSQNGWNHSGRSGNINWIIGTDGSTNAQRSLDIHDQLSKFFAQDRYKNVIAFYGLVNEPGITIPQSKLSDWTASAVKIVSDNGVAATQVFSEALRGLPAWQGNLQGHGNGLVVDVHEYTIFDTNLIVFDHAKKVDFVCSTFVGQLSDSINTDTGFGPTMVGEWSQADTDCAQWVNGVGNGARWTGNFSGKATPACPTENSQCSCTMANQPVSSYSDDYKTFLLTFAQAQMSAYETAWGWFYWTWKTENAPLWSYQAGLQGGFMPQVAYKRSFNCGGSAPSFGSLPEYY